MQWRKACDNGVVKQKEQTRRVKEMTASYASWQLVKKSKNLLRCDKSTCSMHIKKGAKTDRK